MGAAYLPLPTDQTSAEMQSESHALECHASNIVAKPDRIGLSSDSEPATSHMQQR